MHSRDHDTYIRSVLSSRARSLTFEGLPRDVAAVLTHIHAHLYDESLSVSTVRDRCRLTNNNVSTRFKLAVGMGIKEYIDHERLEAAKVLLRHPAVKVYHIARAVGYAYVETFVRSFHRHVGCTPSEYRRRQVDVQEPGA